MSTHSGDDEEDDDVPSPPPPPPAVPRSKSLTLMMADYHHASVSEFSDVFADDDDDKIDSNGVEVVVEREYHSERMTRTLMWNAASNHDAQNNNNNNSSTSQQQQPPTKVGFLRRQRLTTKLRLGGGGTQQQQRRRQPTQSSNIRNDATTAASSVALEEVMDVDDHVIVASVEETAAEVVDDDIADDDDDDDNNNADAASVGSWWSDQKSLRSVTSRRTICSYDTVKVSNLQQQQQPQQARVEQPSPATTQNQRADHQHHHNTSSKSNNSRRWGSNLKRLLRSKFSKESSGEEEGIESKDDDDDNDKNEPLGRPRRRAFTDENPHTNNNNSHQNNNSNNNRNNSYFFQRGRRVRSSDDNKRNDDSTTTTPSHNNNAAASTSTTKLTKRQQYMLDHGIRGRLDGVDIMFLGSAQFSSSMPSMAAESAKPWQKPFQCTFTGESPHWSPRQIVSEMLWSSTGKDPPEIVLEGIYPGPDSRWTVRIDGLQQRHQRRNNMSSTPPPPPKLKSKKNERSVATSSPPPLDQSTASLDNKRATVDVEKSPLQSSSTTQLRRILWGSDPAPVDASSLRTTDGNSNGDHNSTTTTATTEPLHYQLSSKFSVPIDVDEDCLMINTRDHIQAIHDVVGICLADGDFDKALKYMETLLKGVNIATLDPDLRSIQGATLHNMGWIQLWMSEQNDAPREAALRFEQAYEERKKRLPPLHSDLTATLLRKALATFADGNLDESALTIKKALHVIPNDHIICAKALNNLGVVHYLMNRDSKLALSEFTQALEIQRQWLDGAVRRETTVYDASVTLCNMGKVYMESSNYDLAIHVYEEALLLLTTIFRTDHDMVLYCLLSLAVAKGRKGHIVNALQILQGCLRSQNNRFGALSAASMETVGLSGYLYATSGDYESSLKCLTTVRKWQLANLPNDHPAIQTSNAVIAAIEKASGIDTKPSPSNMIWV